MHWQQHHLFKSLLILITIGISACKTTDLATVTSSTSSHQSSLPIGQGDNNLVDLEVVFIEPHSRLQQIGQFEKLELGIQLPQNIEAAIIQFLNNKNAELINPYDPDQINVEATFIHEKDSFKTFGFYYNDYRRDPKTNNAWKEVYTDYHWRVRFAPPDTGKWLCNLQITIANNIIDTIVRSGIEFTCIEKSKTGFIEVAEDKRHFKFSKSNEPFFPIGQNLPWTDEPIFTGHWLNANENGFYSENLLFKNKLYHVGFQDLLNYTENVGENKGNMIRTVSCHNSYLFEWEERGVYGSNRNPKDQKFLRQKRSWELDQLFNTAENIDLKILFCLEFQGQFTYNWDGGNENSYYYNPYNSVQKDYKSTHTQPQDFFTESELINNYKKKLRYFMARWGYSPSLGIFQLLSEFDGWSADSTQVNKKLHDIIRTDPKLQKNIQNWHNEIGTYIHKISHRPIIVTSGLMTNTKPTDIPLSRNLYNADGMDIVIWDKYGNDRSINYEMYESAKLSMDRFDKPFIYAETGLITNPEKNADPGDLEGCDDVMFHNFLWAGSVFGNAGASFEWWQPFDNKRRENYRAMHHFYSTIPFDSLNFTNNKRWNDGGTALFLCGYSKRLLNNNSKMEVYYVISKDDKKRNINQQSYGWAHNLTNYWANLNSYMNCPDRRNKLAKNNSCSDDIFNEPILLNETDYQLKLKGYKPNKTFYVEWYNTRGEGGLLKRQEVKSNSFGTILVNWPGSEFDYAFKIIEKNKELIK